MENESVVQLWKRRQTLISLTALRRRLAAGWDRERAITQPLEDRATIARKAGKANSRKMKALGRSPVNSLSPNWKSF